MVQGREYYYDLYYMDEEIEPQGDPWTLSSVQAGSVSWVLVRVPPVLSTAPRHRCSGSILTTGLVSSGAGN